MAGTAIIGRGGKLAVSTGAGGDGTTGYNDIGGIVSMAPDFSIEEVDTTDMDSNGFKEFILGDMMGEVALSLNAEEDDTQQGTARTAFWTRVKYYYRIRPQTGSGKINVYGQAWVTRWPLDIPSSSKQSQNAKIKFTGTITMALQA